MRKRNQQRPPQITVCVKICTQECKKKEHKDVDVISKFDQRTLSVENENNLNNVIFDFHKHGTTFEHDILLAV